MKIDRFSEFSSYLEGADHTDVETVEGAVTLRSFIARFLSYQPAWVTALYGMRAIFVRLLGMKQEEMPHAPHISPGDVSMTPGESAHFFSVQLAEEGRYWLAGIEDQHLNLIGVHSPPLAALK